MMGKKGDQKGRNRELVRNRAVVSCRCGPKGLIIIYRRGGGEEWGSGFWLCPHRINWSSPLSSVIFLLSPHSLAVNFYSPSLYNLLPATDPPPVPPENHGIPQKPSPLPRRRQIMVPKGNRKERQLGSGEIESGLLLQEWPGFKCQARLSVACADWVCCQFLRLLRGFFLWIFRYNTFDGRKSFKFSYSPRPFEAASPNGS